MPRDRPLLGIGLMLLFCALAPLGDGIAKVLGDVVPLVVLLFVRFASQAILLTPLTLRRGPQLSGRQWRLMAVRTGLHMLGIGMMFTALRYLPLADAIAIAFVMPFFMLVLAKYVLGEEVGPRRIWACVVGFAGTLLIVQPSFAQVGAPALLPLGVAVCFALFMLTTRQLARDVDPVRLQALSGWMASAVLLLGWLISAEALGARQFWPDGPVLLLLALLGAIGTAAHLAMTWALRLAPSATLAPMQYLEIPFATAIGWMIFQDLPNGLAALGIAVTVSAGLYILWREHRPASELGP
ncbi:putative S-adenosylmethionine uptake transporter [Dinoroseobacter shibae DFL 12 = DSM 16493]|jgi:drug/metabolite transporter (DMT)-like permease|uniref:Putative S-adenosylmethionine uptake transporter n=1 Tax=Dinoroseobacter shibae (strain DSM 16493 / NCIMB 14021 / DFL 12) TaxID=398580 RepID=A8LQL7_DINSH|nr:DMT family transporter [Dinoroseobacter shibae]ABV93884.1 putative S-adenosylmethionine uptake transporter [Dinoroseobacter shibae DFL 12 = DSM 16493]URF45334.1 DMT family transporter [Dinoroseobacter shibae]URF49639.1 DMT family transporter [Dinoroseobacter shibae]